MSTIVIPPGRCLRTLPRALRPSTAPFSTSTHRSLPAPAKKKTGTFAPPKRGERTLKLKKRDVVRETRPPAPGERKAVRKRIVLSNTNALEPAGLVDLTADMAGAEEVRGRVVGIPGEVVDALRVVEGFKVGQGWAFFRRPAALMRNEVVELAREMEGVEQARGADERAVGSGVRDLGGQTLRKLVYGERGTGKSVLLLQAMATAFLRGWVVISIPEARDLYLGQTEYAPLPNTSPVQYTQNEYTAKLLAQIAKANRPVLSKLKLTHAHNLPIKIKPGLTLDAFAELGVNDPEIAWPVFQALWTELTAPAAEADAEGKAVAVPRPQILLAIDNVAPILRPTQYKTLDADGKLRPIHPQDFVLVKHFLDYFRGARTLPQGGLVLAATSGNETVKSDALSVGIAMAEARVANPENKQLKLGDFWNLYKEMDMRSLEAVMDVEALKLEGLSKAEARAVIEYWAGNGMVRSRVEEGFVGEKWTLAGGGVVGELEKAVVRMRF
ncbi:hypothetical protein EJ06DRAFT_501996 [Trichodelitschia bisporula]|uniref:Small ribosomal subunit protein mS29 n=1 Tax=Trichodelitschia bisporula TaxID=703511 RepID=A0A6G1I9W1_9PEZI|nr:hypothetical protein EJ06DRAFT_501996 [Trichodelitschia bisporula]